MSCLFFWILVPLLTLLIIISSCPSLGTGFLSKKQRSTGSTLVLLFVLRRSLSPTSRQPLTSWIVLCLKGQLLDRRNSTHTPRTLSVSLDSRVWRHIHTLTTFRCMPARNRTTSFPMFGNGSVTAQLTWWLSGAHHVDCNFIQIRRKQSGLIPGRATASWRRKIAVWLLALRRSVKPMSYMSKRTTRHWTDDEAAHRQDLSGQLLPPASDSPSSRQRGLYPTRAGNDHIPAGLFQLSAGGLTEISDWVTAESAERRCATHLRTKSPWTRLDIFSGFRRAFYFLRRILIFSYIFHLWHL